MTSIKHPFDSSKRLTILVEPKRFPHSDQDVRHDESAQIWSALGGLALAVGLGIFLLYPAAKSRLEAARAEAKFQAEMADEARQMRELMAQMKREGGEARRIALELEAIRAQRVAR